MTNAEKKEKFLDAYRDSYGNLTEALKRSKLKASDYSKFIELPDFKREIEATQQLRDDLIESKFLNLVETGDVRAVIEAKKMLAEKKDGLDVDEMKVKTMIYLITHAETKSEALTAYCDWFRVAERTAEKFYQKIVIEKALKGQTPIERAKEARKKIESSLSERFKNNNLSEIEMLQGLLEQALFTAETAEYPSERATASKEAREIGRRMEEIQERERIKNTFNNEEWVDIIDSIVLDSNIEKVKELKQKQMLLEAE